MHYGVIFQLAPIMLKLSKCSLIQIFLQIVGTVDQAAAEVTAVAPVMMKGGEVETIKSKKNLTT